MDLPQSIHNIGKSHIIDSKRTRNNAFKASLLFRSLELWMNLHLVRHHNCIEQVMCEGMANIVKTGYSNDSALNGKHLSRVYAEFSGYDES